MIVSQPSKLKFRLTHPDNNKMFYKKDVGGFIPVYEHKDCSFIELRTIFGKLIYRLERNGEDLNMERPDAKAGYRFQGQWDYLKIHRNPDPLIDSFNVQLYCSNCGENIYKLTGKLPLLFKIKTDFYVETDTSNS